MIQLDLSIVVGFRISQLNLNIGLIFRFPPMLTFYDVVYNARRSLLMLQSHSLPYDLAISCKIVNPIMFDSTLIMKVEEIVNTQNEMKKLRNPNLQLQNIECCQRCVGLEKQVKQIFEGQNKENINTDYSNSKEYLTLLDKIKQMEVFSIEKIIQACHHPQSSVQNACQFYQNLACLPKIVQGYIEMITKQQTTKQDISKCSFNTDQAINSSNSASVRSLLTEKLKQARLEDFDDPETSTKYIIRGNLIRELSRSSNNGKRVNYHEDISQPYSVQGRQLKELRRSNMEQKREKAQTQRQILMQIGMKESQISEKKSQQHQASCARCEIY